MWVGCTVINCSSIVASLLRTGTQGILRLGKLEALYRPPIFLEPVRCARTMGVPNYHQDAVLGSQTSQTPPHRSPAKPLIPYPLPSQLIAHVLFLTRRQGIFKRRIVLFRRNIPRSGRNFCLPPKHMPLRRAQQPTPAHWSKDFVEHLRTVHFALIATALALIVIALTTKPYSTDVAKY